MLFTTTPMSDLVIQDQLLFPELFWSKPLNRSYGGRLLAVGGRAQHFSDIQLFFQLVNAAGIGECQMALPDVLRKLIGEQAGLHYVPSTPSGSLGRGSLAALLELAANNDAIVGGLDWGSNSETVILLESLIIRTRQPLILPIASLAQQNLSAKQLPSSCLLIGSMRDLFGLASKFQIPLRQDGSGLLAQVSVLRQVAAAVPADYWLTGHHNIVLAQGQISATPAADESFVLAASLASTFWLQYPRQRFAALSGAAYTYKEVAQQSPKNSTELIKRIREALERLEF